MLIRGFLYFLKSRKQIVLKNKGTPDLMRNNSSGSGKRGLTEKFERYFGKSISVKIAVCLGVAIVFLAATLMFALLMNVFTPGSVADVQSNVSSVVSDASASSSGLPINSSLSGIDHSAVNGSYDHAIAEYGDDDKRASLEHIYNLTSNLPSVTPTPLPVPTPMIAPKLPLEVLWDKPFYESIEPIQNYDRKKLLVDDTSYRFDNGPLLMDPSGTYAGSVYAYPGDTIGIRLHIYNNGKLLSTVARVDITLLKMANSKNNAYVDTGVNLHYYMDIQSEESTGMEKDMLINIPKNNPGSAGYYKLSIKLYVNNTLSSDMSKEFNVL